MIEQNKSLLELTSDFGRLMQLLVEASGEMTPDLEQELAVNQEMLAAKADKYEFVIARLELEESHWKERAERYTKVAKACATARQRLRDAIKDTMQIMGVTEIKGEDACFKLTNAAPRLVIDEKQLPDIYFDETIVREPNKESIKRNLKEGKSIPGAVFEPVFALRSGILRKGK